MDLNLTDKVAIVTGGAAGIGEAITRGFCTEGAKTVVVGRPNPKTESLMTELTDAGFEICFIKADLCDESACKSAVEQILSRYGKIDILVNNAGKNNFVSLKNSPADFKRSLELNLVHYFTMAHYCRKELIQNSGTIINISSKVAITGQGSTSGYAASKGGVNALTREWAVELCEYNVRVNTVVPAEVLTPMYQESLEHEPDPEIARARIESMIPLGHHFTKTKEIADTVLFLASERSSHTTGQLIFVDGGYTHLDRNCTN